MRIISGKNRGKKLIPFDLPGTRPMSDRARESIFNILDHKFKNYQGGAVLDAFAGSSALGLESFSRGAAQIYFMDKEKKALEIVRQNVNLINATATLHQTDSTKPPAAPQAMDLIFIAPPYGMDLAAPTVTGLEKQGWIGEKTLLVIEIEHKKDAVPENVNIVEDRNYGRARILFATK